MYRRSQPLLSQNNQKMIEKLAEIPLLYPPNQNGTIVYTDVLGHLIEKIKAKPERFFTKRIFEPLEMKDTSFHIDKANSRGSHPPTMPN